MKNNSVPEIMGEALKTYTERNKQYGDSYLRHGEVMLALLPFGVELASQEDFNRFGVLNMIVSKLVRYCQHFHQPHIDSIHDLGVYAFIGESLDRDFFEKQGKEEEIIWKDKK